MRERGERRKNERGREAQREREKGETEGVRERESSAYDKMTYI